MKATFLVRPSHSITLDEEPTQVAQALSQPKSAFDPVLCKAAKYIRASGRTVSLVKLQAALWSWGRYYADKHPVIYEDIQQAILDIDNTVNLKLCRSLIDDGLPISDGAITGISNRTTSNREKRRKQSFRKKGDRLRHFI